MSLIAIIIACIVVLIMAVPFSMVGQGGGSTYVPVLLVAGMEFLCRLDHQPVYDYAGQSGGYPGLWAEENS